MPSGRTHDRITLWGLPWIVVTAYLLTRRSGLTLIVAGTYLFSGLMFGPDLDIHSIQYRRWGVLRWLWLPYRSLFKHRSFFSHGLIIGTVLRLVYLVFILLLVGIMGNAIAFWVGGIKWDWQSMSANLWQWLKTEGTDDAIALFIGLELGAMSHAMSDYLGSTYSKFQKPKKKRARKRAQGNRKQH